MKCGQFGPADGFAGAAAASGSSRLQSGFHNSALKGHKFLRIIDAWTILHHLLLLPPKYSTQLIRIEIWFLVTQEQHISAESQMKAVPMHIIWSRSVIIRYDIVIIYSHSCSIAKTYWSSLWNVDESPWTKRFCTTSHQNFGRNKSVN